MIWYEQMTNKSLSAIPFLVLALFPMIQSIKQNRTKLYYSLIGPTKTITDPREIPYVD